MITNAQNPEILSGPRKAAVLLVLIGDAASAELIKQLSDDEVQLVSREIARIRTITSEQAENILEEFYQMVVAKDFVVKGGIDYAKKILMNAFGPEVAKKMLDVQVAALRMHDVRTLITTFGDEGFLIGPSDVAGPNHSYLFTGAIAAILSRPSVGVLADVTVTSYHAGGNGDDLVWLAAELVASYQGEDRSVRSVPLRVSESLFKTKEAWRVSMAHVAVPTTDLSPRAMPLMGSGIRRCTSAHAPTTISSSTTADTP